jgi:hypothetical protein
MKVVKGVMQFAHDGRHGSDPIVFVAQKATDSGKNFFVVLACHGAGFEASFFTLWLTVS